MTGSANGGSQYYPTKDVVRYDKGEESATSSVSRGETEQTTLIVPAVENVVKLHHAALALSWASVTFSLLSGIAAIVLGAVGENESLFAYGLDAVLDSFSSVAVVWRFHGDADSVYSASRELKACIAIGCLFLVSATCLITKSVYSLVIAARESKNCELFITFCVVCGVISVGLAIGKIYIGYKLNSRALATDSIITLVGAASCFASIISLLLYVEDNDLWFLDSVFSIFCGVFLLIFGLRLIYTTVNQSKISKLDDV